LSHLHPYSQLVPAKVAFQIASLDTRKSHNVISSFSCGVHLGSLESSHIQLLGLSFSFGYFSMNQQAQKWAIFYFLKMSTVTPHHLTGSYSHWNNASFNVGNAP
jgi:hypothetical protein